MTKQMIGVWAIAGGLVSAASAQAQTTTARPETGAYVTFGAGAQPQTRSFGGSGTFTTFNETGRYNVVQNIGAGMLIDVGGGYQFMKRLSVGISVWSARSKSAAAAGASIPGPVFFRRFTNVSADGEGLKQSTLGANIVVTYSLPVAGRFDLALSGGPTIVRTSLDASRAIVTASSQTLRLETDRQSKTSAKAANAGVDFTYRVNEMYSLGFFARYAGGDVDLPAVNKLKVGSVQTGGLIRYRF